jgi:hypothetical protein
MENINVKLFKRTVTISNLVLLIHVTQKLEIASILTIALLHNVMQTLIVLLGDKLNNSLSIALLQFVIPLQDLVTQLQIKILQTVIKNVIKIQIALNLLMDQFVFLTLVLLTLVLSIQIVTQDLFQEKLGVIVMLQQLPQ